MAEVERTPRCHAINEVYGEDGEIACWSVTESKREIRDSKPVHVGIAILQWSKLLFIRYDIFENIPLLTKKYSAS